MSRFINTELKSDSDSETESKSDIELMAKLEYFWCMQNLFVKKKLPNNLIYITTNT